MEKFSKKEEIKIEFCKEILHKYNLIDDGICVKIVNNIPCKCNLLRHTHSKIYSEIDIEKTLLMDPNKSDPIKKLTKEKIENITYGVSKIKLWFKCKNSKCKCFHSYETRPNDRTCKRRPTGCPYCCSGGPNKKICECFSNSFMNDPILASQWDYEKNKGIDPWTISRGSGEKFWWICRDHTTCKEHSWEARIFDRTNGNKCPFCVTNTDKTCICNSISRTHPRLCLDILKHLNPEINLEKTSAGSNKIITFECYLCKFNWPTTINNRTVFGSSERCPQCAAKCSDFEFNCKEILIKLNLNSIVQQKLHYIPSRRYDFIFQYNGIIYMIETDGEHHFKQNSCWHPTDEKFIKQQNADRIKTIIPIFYNYVIIRLSNDNSQHIENCIKYILSLKLSKPSIIFDDVQKYLYIANDIFQNPDKVNYLIDNFVDQQYKDHCKELYKTTNFDIIDLKSYKIWTNYI